VEYPDRWGDSYEYHQKRNKKGIFHRIRYSRSNYMKLYLYMISSQVEPLNSACTGI
jgi:hypothetical protein